MNSSSIISLSALLLLAGLTGCTSDTPDVTTTEVESTVTSGVWKITYFYDTDKEETAHFNGYEFHLRRRWHTDRLQWSKHCYGYLERD